MMLMKSAFVKNLENSKSVAAFLANAGSLAIALFKLLVTGRRVRPCRTDKVYQCRVL